MFSREQAFAGLTEVPGATVHQAVRANAPGAVDLWPMIEPDEKRELEGWDAPFDETQETSPRVRLARAHRQHRQDAGSTGASRSATARARAGAGDILVLVRQRGALFDAIIRALKDANVEVAGADRLMLTEHIAVMDLIALADALLLPRRRSRARERAEEPAVRADRRAALHPRVEAQGHAARGAAREGAAISTSPA